MPQLPGHESHKVERVLLDDNLDASDIKQLFDAVNEQGRLNGIAPWMRGAPESELNAVGGLLSRYIYEPALDRDGLVSLLSDRVSKKSFSRLKDSRKGASRSGGALAELAKAAINSPHFVDIIERDIGILAPELDQPLNEILSDFLKTWDADSSEPASQPEEIVTDLQNFLKSPGMKGHWTKFFDSVSTSWPIVGLLHAMREVDHRHDGKAFDGMGGGLAKMLLTPRFPGKPVPTQFDSLMDLFLALNEPSDGLFSSIQNKISGNAELIREAGSVIQPNLSSRLLGYYPVLPHAIAGLFIGSTHGEGAVITADSWKLLSQDPKAESGKEAFLQFFIAARTAHENIAGPAKDSLSEDALIFNLPLYLNGWVFAQWLSNVLVENQALVSSLAPDTLNEKIWDTKIHSKAFEFSLTETSPTGELVFAPSRLQELAAFGLEDFTKALSKNTPTGLGGFHYSIPELKNISLREATKLAFEKIDETRGYADSSSALRAVITYLTAPGQGGKSFLENMETPNMLLSAHRFLASVPPATWKKFTSGIFDTVGSDSLNDETKKALSGFYEENPNLLKKFSRILDSVGMLKSLDQAPASGSLSAFEAYQEVLSEVGPREWKALSEAWVFLGTSKLLSVDLQADGTAAPRYPAVFRWMTSGNSSGAFKFAAKMDPSRYRVVADVVGQMTQTQAGISGSELHWDFLTELATKSPNGLAALIREFQEGDGSGLRDLLTVQERLWIIEFVKSGSFRELWQIISPHLKNAGQSGSISQLRQLSKEGTLRTTFQLLTLIKNDRMRAVARALQSWEASGELAALLDLLEALPGGS